LLTAAAVWAHQPHEEDNAPPAAWPAAFDAKLARPAGDPTRASVAIYGSIGSPSEIDLYRFTASKDGAIPLEVLAPVRPYNRDFRPALVIIGSSLERHSEAGIPLQLPGGLQAFLVPAPSGSRKIFREPFSMERLYRGIEIRLAVRQGQTYYVGVFSPDRIRGSYSLGLGTVEDFKNVSFLEIITSVLRIKVGLEATRPIPWADLLPLAAVMISLALGLGGAVAEARRVWQYIALGLLIASFAVLYRESLVSGVAIFQMLAVIPIAWGARRLAPRDFPVTLVSGWLAQCLLAAWYVVVLRELH
jgi:hypothetical protein